MSARLQRALLTAAILVLSLLQISLEISINISLLSYSTPDMQSMMPIKCTHVLAVGHGAQEDQQCVVSVALGDSITYNCN